MEQNMDAKFYIWLNFSCSPCMNRFEENLCKVNGTKNFK